MKLVRSRVQGWMQHGTYVQGQGNISLRLNHSQAELPLSPNRYKTYHATVSVLALKYLEHFLACAPLEEFMAHLEVPNGFVATFSWTEVQQGIFGWVVLPRFGQCLDGMINLSWQYKKYERTKMEIRHC